MSEKRRSHLMQLYHAQGGLCHICHKPADLDFNGGKVNNDNSAVRMQLGSRFAHKIKSRPRVMAHRKCADERSRSVQLSIPIEEQRQRARRFPTEFYQAAQNKTEEV